MTTTTNYLDNSHTSSPSSSSSSSSAEDVIVVRDRYLYKAKDYYINNNNKDDVTNHSKKPKRFIMKGIAFPDPPPLKPQVATPDNPNPPSTKPGFNYNATAWIAILQQLRNAIPDQNALNTVRIYRMDPTVDYSEFFNAAKELGFYILVPLTSVNDKDGAILNRALRAPKCYPPTLLQYGIMAYHNYGRYSNVLAGVIGNEVMNTMESWYAAPCVKAYARDLQSYMKKHHQMIVGKDDGGSFANRTLVMSSGDDGHDMLMTLPLMYAAQHSGIGAVLTETDTMRLTIDYLSCSDGDDDDKNSNEKNGEDEFFTDIDIFGINVESWCSSIDTTLYQNPDGSINSYYQLYRGLQAGIKIPIIFSELGCSHREYDKDNIEFKTPNGTRNWNQIPVVISSPMNSTWSGFSAYAYDGTPLFAMTNDGPWDGRTPLELNEDFTNFQNQLLMNTKTASTGKTDEHDDGIGTAGDETEENNIFHDLPLAAGGVMDEYYNQILQDGNQSSPTCGTVQTVLHQTCDLKLMGITRMPSYYKKIMNEEHRKRSQNVANEDGPTPNHLGLIILSILIAIVVVTLAAVHMWKRHTRNKERRAQYELIP